ncbi:glycosyltransferase [Aeromicrobium wangtongii]|uniref:Glycosyltransferase n=1 Tax=Aeromicrobium wangtongii TaxID=2969247 RepID=A0ABY5M6Z2_9ACTN|nr:glycosyltransferase [Aeromicrobium wangtongii]MCD9199980.1 glycosyltransferase [Aeromicrobium wangtongii]UUP13597.1 glycosyltransferase [Aeromicrobium wangtongii]
MHLSSRLRHRGPAQRVLESGLFLPSFYEAQAGTQFTSARQAVEHYLSQGAGDGLLPHPLIDPSVAHETERAAALAAALTSTTPVESHRFSTAYDWTGYVAAVPSASSHPGGVAGHYAATERRPDDAVVLHLASGDPVDWTAVQEAVAVRARTMPTVLASQLFDVDFYQAQTGAVFGSRRAALWHYLSVGEAAGLAANPLFEPEWLAERSGATAPSLIEDYLGADLATVSPHPHFDPVAYLAQVPDAADHPGGPLGHFLTAATADSTTWPVDAALAPRSWGELRSSLFDAAVTFAAQQQLRTWGAARPWDAQASHEIATTERPPSVSIVLDLSRATGRTKRRIAQILDDDPALQIVAAASSDDPRIGDLDPRVTVVTTSSTNHSERINAAVRQSSGEYVHVWHPRDTPRAGFYRRSIMTMLEAGTELVYSATTSAPSHDALVMGEPYSRDGLIWGEPQAAIRTALVSRSLFDRVGGYDPALPAFADWDFLLRASATVDPVFVPQIGLEADPKPVGVRHSTRAYEHVVRAAQICDWSADGPREESRVSVLIPVYEDWAMTTRVVASILATTVDEDVEIVLLDNGSRRSVGALIEAIHGDEPRVTHVRVPRNTNFATGSNLAFLASTGRRVVFMNNDTVPAPGWLRPLLDALDDPSVRAAQPLLLFNDGTAQTGGTVFHRGAFPWHFLQGHPVEDVLAAGQTRFSAITAATMAGRAAEIHQLRGFDPVYVNGLEDVDLCLRLSGNFGGDFRVALDSVVLHAESQSAGRFEAVGQNRIVFMDRWLHRLPGSDAGKYESAGLHLAHYRASRQHPRSGLRTGEPVVTRPPRQVLEGPAAGLPSLRWAVKTAAEPGPAGDLAPDTVLAGHLAGALRRLGQEVVVDRRESHVRLRSDHLDDVVLAIAGDVPVAPQPGATNVLWVGDADPTVDAGLVDRFDLVYSDDMTEAFDARATTLLADVLDALGVEHHLGG